MYPLRRVSQQSLHRFIRAPENGMMVQETEAMTLWRRRPRKLCNYVKDCYQHSVIAQDNYGKRLDRRTYRLDGCLAQKTAKNQDEYLDLSLKQA